MCFWAILPLLLKHRIKHKSSRGPYLSSRKVAKSASLFSPYKSCSSLHLWNDASIFIYKYLSIYLVFSPARSTSLFLHCFSSSVFFIFLFVCFWRRHSSALLLSVLHHCLQFGLELERIWPGKSRCCAWVREGSCQQREWLTFLRPAPWLWLAMLIWEQYILASQIRATEWIHKQLTCNLFYCQITMTILANITKKC